MLMRIFFRDVMDYSYDYAYVMLVTSILSHSKSKDYTKADGLML